MPEKNIPLTHEPDDPLTEPSESPAETNAALEESDDVSGMTPEEIRQRVAEQFPRLKIGFKGYEGDI